MELEKEFFEFVNLVVVNEMDINQNEIFELEGKELTKKFVNARNVNDFVVSAKSQGVDFVISPEGVQAISKTVIEIGTFLLSCLTLYLKYKEPAKKEQTNPDYDIEIEFKEELIKNKIEKNKATEIAKKYSVKLKKIL